MNHHISLVRSTETFPEIPKEIPEKLMTQRSFDGWLDGFENNWIWFSSGSINGKDRNGKYEKITHHLTLLNPCLPSIIYLFVFPLLYTTNRKIY